ncbi:uncharacterized protein LOC124200426 isoform X2 [Daphnia pulex]|uniref:uncharacterized protein LOC124200426 isoform X2 n=1 Tax=Daphnia pulex TaxID=6669 RepID=UPI001EDE4619|nr:uncharacterized protein LOC124200426 isoform X2 [Daphnia pulex]
MISFNSFNEAFNSSAATKIVDSTAHLLPSHSSAKFYNVVKLGECVEEFDMTKREAKFAFRSTDLGSWDSDFFASVSDITNSKPKTIQHWALVVHFPRGKKTYFFKARADNGLLLAYRAEGVAYQVFEKATYIGTVETCPSELLEKAKQVPTGEYDVLLNNRQTWLKDFLLLISPELLVALHDKVPDTKTYLNYLARKFNK